MMINEIKKNSRSLSKDEMKEFKGGVAEAAAEGCGRGFCDYYEAHTGPVLGVCEINSNGRCVCNAGTSSILWDKPCYYIIIVPVAD